MNTKIKILIVDDHIMFLEGLNSLLSKENTIEVVGIASHGLMALKILEQKQVDIIITDINMPEIDGFELLHNIQKKYRNTSTLVLSMYCDPLFISKLIKNKVNGYLPKNAEKNELLKAIKVIYKGENYFPEEVKKIYTTNLFSRSKKRNFVPVLSKREIEVLKLVVEEYKAKEIAEKLFISQHTVESHRKNIFSKLNVKNIAGLVKYAIEKDLI